MASFITVAELKAYPLPVTSSQWQKVGDDQIETVIAYASDHLEDYMDRAIDVTAYTDRIHRGSGFELQMLSVFPVVSLSSAYAIDGSNNRTLIDNAELLVDGESGMVEYLNRNRYKFSKYQKYEFNYTAGFSTVPGPLKHATALQTVKMLQPLFRGGSNFSEVELITELDEQIVELLDYYKRRRIS
jgi:hypothetical protein